MEQHDREIRMLAERVIESVSMKNGDADSIIISKKMVHDVLLKFGEENKTDEIFNELKEPTVFFTRRMK